MKTKHLLSGVAVIAALALSAPVWAQQANPSGGNAVGTPGPNPGGPGLTPYSTGAPPPSSLSSPRGTVHMPAPPSASDTTSAMPPMHHHGHAHHVASTHQMLHAHGPKSGTDTTAQLNQAELARLQAGNFTPPPVPPGPEMAPPASDGMN
ncbi:MAG: hypothetical protein WBX30_19395, partial [Stellaceae bacterium]